MNKTAVTPIGINQIGNRMESNSIDNIDVPHNLMDAKNDV